MPLRCMPLNNSIVVDIEDDGHGYDVRCTAFVLLKSSLIPT